MLIRNEQEGDRASIANIVARAFAGEEHSDQTEPMIIERLRTTGALTISLVAVERNSVVGHIAFSPVTINGTVGLWFGLGPVSVDPDFQCKGIGSDLIREGLGRLRSHGAVGCVVLGSPAYYSRFGFKQNNDLWYKGAPSEYFMLLVLNGDKPAIGRVDYAPAFSR